MHGCGLIPMRLNCLLTKYLKNDIVMLHFNIEAFLDTKYTNMSKIDQVFRFFMQMKNKSRIYVAFTRNIKQ